MGFVMVASHDVLVSALELLAGAIGTTGFVLITAIISASF
jgi:hypothetical protein